MRNGSAEKDQLSLSLVWGYLPLLGPDEIYAQAGDGLLRTIREDSRVERKPPNYAPRALGDYLSMWANTPPSGGLVVVGMENDGTISGCSDLGQKRLNELEETSKIFCPEARCEFKRVPATRKDGSPDFLMLFRVHYRADKVVETVSGTAYHRLGESKRKLNNDEVRELQRDKRQVDFEQEPVNAIYPDDFDMPLLREFTAAVRRQRGLDDDHADKEILELRHLGKLKNGNFQPNVSCLLLFAKDPAGEFPGCKIRFLRFDGETEHTGEHFNAVKDIYIEGPLSTQITEIEKVLDGQLRDFARLGPDGKFYSAQEYPKLAWYEAIVNACVHRSYGLRNMNIFVKMFDDRLVIESPGPFPPTVTPQNIYNVHNPRNPHLMEAMYYLKYVKCAHEGAKRIRDTMAEMRLPAPEFQEKQSDIGNALVLVTLRNNIKQRKTWVDSDATSLIGETIFATLTQDQRRAINFVAEYGSVTVTQLARVTGRAWATAKNTLDRLDKMGLLRHVKKKSLDRDPKAHYVLRKTT